MAAAPASQKRARVEAGKERVGNKKKKWAGPAKPYRPIAPARMARQLYRALDSGATGWGPTGEHATSGQPSTPPWLGLSRQHMWRNTVLLSRHAQWRDQRGYELQYIFSAVNIKIFIKKGLKF
jgi:hypothetical protein